jgi:ApaG protein
MTNSATTRDIRVSVESEWVPERSQPQRNAWFFTYLILIENLGDDVVQLISRHWIIENAVGRSEEVRGPGVVGETPVLGPGESFQYRSFCPLDTPVGSMRGTYQMRRLDDGQLFDIEIPVFTLAMPSALN